MENNCDCPSILDVSDWPEDEFRQAPGVRQKSWLMNPKDHSLEMFKIPRDNTGEAWSEQVGSRLGRRLGFDTADTRLALYRGQIGSLSQNFVNIGIEEFFEGGDVLSLANPEFERRSLQGYDMDFILSVLNRYGLEQDFLTIPVFDAFIANQDRHCDNWGVIRNTADGSYRLAPLYDNGCALGQSIRESDLESYLCDPGRMAAFIRRGYSLIGLSGERKPKFLKLLSHLRKSHEHMLSYWIDRVSDMQEQDARDTVNVVPDWLMSGKRKEFTCKLLSQRKAWLLDWWKERS